MTKEYTCALILSARTQHGLRQMAETAAQWLSETTETLQDICRNVNRRKHWNAFGLAVIASNPKDAAASLRDYCDGNENERPITQRSVPVDNPAQSRAMVFATAVARYGILKEYGAEPDSLYVNGDGLIAAAYIACAVDEDWALSALRGDLLSAATNEPQIKLKDAETEADLTPVLFDRSRLENYLAKTAPQRSADVHLSLLNTSFADFLATAQLESRSVKWAAAYPQLVRAGTDFPKSTFDRNRHWPTPQTVSTNGSSLAIRDDTLIDRFQRIPGLGGSLAESAVVPQKRSEYADHQVYGRNVIAGACHLSLMIEAARKHLQQDTIQISNLRFERALAVTPNMQRVFQITQFTDDAGQLISKSTSVAANGSGNEIAHANAKVMSGNRAFPTFPMTGDELDSFVDGSARRALDGAEFYNAMHVFSRIAHGPAFRWVSSLELGEGFVRAELCPPKNAPQSGFLPPGLIDCCFQIVAATMEMEEPTTFVPSGCHHIDISGVHYGSQLRAQAVLDRRATGPNRIVGSVILLSETDEKIAEFRDVEFRRATEALLLGATNSSSHLQRFSVDWTPAADDSLAVDSTSCIVMGDASRSHEAHELCKSIQSLNVPCRVADDFGSDEARIIYFCAKASSPQDLRPLQETHAFVQQLLTSAPSVKGLALVNIDETEHNCSAPFGSAIWGYGRVLANEHPELRLQQIDLTSNRTSSFESAAKEICSSSSRPQLSLSGEEVFEPHLTLIHEPAQSLKIRSKRPYLITGAFGGVGRKIAHNEIARRCTFADATACRCCSCRRNSE